MDQLQELGLLYSIAYLDIEHYSTNNPSCSADVRAYVNAFVATMHASGYSAGIYGNADNILGDMIPGDIANVPDAIWVALYNNTPNT